MSFLIRPVPLLEKGKKDNVGTSGYYVVASRPPNDKGLKHHRLFQLEIFKKNLPNINFNVNQDCSQRYFLSFEDYTTTVIPLYIIYTI